MYKIEQVSVEDRIRNGYRFDFGQYLNEAFEIFKKEWLLFSLYSLVFMLILMVSAITVIGPILLSYPGFMGYAVAAEKVERGEKLEFNDFFKSYKNFGNYGLLILIMIGFSLLLYIPCFGLIILAGSFDYNEVNPVFFFPLFLYYFVLIAGMLVLQVSVIFAPFLIHYGGYGAVDALKASFRLSKQNFWWVLVFVILVGVISSVGYLLCFIGIFASMAMGYLMHYSMVKDILTNPEHSEIDQIGNHGYSN